MLITIILINLKNVKTVKLSLPKVVKAAPHFS